NWDELFAEAYAACRPGGWVESFEPSPIVESDHVQIPEDSALRQWGKVCVEAGKILGRSFTVMNDNLQRKGMEAAGFVDLREFEYKVSLHPLLQGGYPSFRLLTKPLQNLRPHSDPGLKIRG